MFQLLKGILTTLTLLTLLTGQATASFEKLSEIHQAIVRGHFADAQALLTNLPDQYISYPLSGSRGDTLLHIALSRSSRDGTTQLALVSTLLAHGADVNRPNDQGQSPLFRIRTGEENGADLLKLLVKRGADINKKDQSGRTSLLQYIQIGQLALVASAIKLGADVNIADKSGNTAIHYAAKKGDIATIDMLTKQGLSIDQKNHKGETGLSALASHSKWSVVRILLEQGADPYVPFRRNHSIAYYLLSHPELGMTNLIDKTRINVNDNSGQKTSLLFDAISKVDLQALELLIQLGVDVNQTNAPNYPAIPHIAEKAPAKYPDAIPMLKKLIAEGADINARKMGRGMTGLGVAARWGHTEFVDLLLENGAEVDNQSIQAAVTSKQYALATRMLKQGTKNTVDLTKVHIWDDIQSMVYTLEKGDNQTEKDEISELITQLFASRPVINLKSAEGYLIDTTRQIMENSSSVVVLNAISKAQFVEGATNKKSRTTSKNYATQNTPKEESITIPSHTYSANAKLHVVGVYGGVDEKKDDTPWWAKCNVSPGHQPSHQEMAECHRKQTGSHTEQQISVNVFAKSGPIILALMSYEPVHWAVRAAPGVTIEGIILGGYHAQRITGVGPSVHIQANTYYPSTCGSCQMGGKYFFAYERSGEKFNNAMQALKTITQRTPVSFQGQHKGKSFSIIDR